VQQTRARVAAALFLADADRINFIAVRHSAFSRFVALVVALTAGLAAPVTALAHGWAHHHESEHRQAAAFGSTHATFEQLGPNGDPVAAPEGDDADHPHQTVDGGPIAKAIQLFAVLAVSVDVPAATVVAAVVSLPTDWLREPVPSQAHAPPPRLRAPPKPLG
jgi:hypothetical protein